MVNDPMKARPILLLLAAFAALLSGPAVRADEPAFRSDFAVVSRQVFRGIARAGSSAQMNVEFAGGGWRGDAWTNQPFDRGQVRETNVNAGYAWNPSEEISLELSAGHSWFNRVPGGGVGHSLESGLTATLANVRGFVPSVACWHDFTFDADTVQLACARSIPLTRLGAFLECNAFAGVTAGEDWRPDAPGPRRRDGYGYWGAEVRLPYRVGAHTTITAGLHYSATSGRSLAHGPFGLSATSNFWATLGVNLDF
ncbi:MAG TPA: hypothetical protein VG936_16560 [Lacunisphaera sp.]|nr:hypothetical protein [Lacunisphaera sp.]